MQVACHQVLTLKIMVLLVQGAQRVRWSFLNEVLCSCLQLQILWTSICYVPGSRSINFDLGIDDLLNTDEDVNVENIINSMTLDEVVNNLDNLQRLENATSGMKDKVKLPPAQRVRGKPSRGTWVLKYQSRLSWVVMYDGYIQPPIHSIFIP